MESAPSPCPRPLSLTDLPREIQKEIVGHCQQYDLICLSVVSKHFHHLAAAELYRNFHIVFPDEDDQAFDSPIDGLAGGLETFVTSDYDYANHLRDISLDTLSAGRKAETAYKPYLYSLSCGKFLNTLLLLTLRKARALETFRWNIRVELSRPVYKALHDIETLSHLCIRLQDGPSLYEQPIPLPFFSPPNTPDASTSHLPIIDAPPPAPTFTLPPPSAPLFLPPPGATLPPPPQKAPVKTKVSKKPSAARNPPTLSGFKSLKTLSVLDIDDLDVITELKSCVRNSQGTLTKLKLSLSHNLAMRARKPPPDPDDSEDPDDEFQVGPAVVPPPAQPYDEATGPARAFRAQEERKNQESALGRILDVEPYLVRRPSEMPTKNEEATAEERKVRPAERFLNTLRSISEKLLKTFEDSDEFTLAQKEIMDTFETAAKKYIDEKDDIDIPTVNGTNGGLNSSGANGGGTAETDSAETSAGQGHSEAEDVQQEGASLFASKTPKARDAAQDASPDDINIEEPVDDSFVEEPAEAASSGPVNGDEDSVAGQSPPKPNRINNAPANDDLASDLGPDAAKAVANLETQKQNFKTLADKLQFFEIQAEELHKEIQQLPVDPGPHSMKRVKDAEKQMHEFSQNIKAIQNEMTIVAAEIQDAERQIPAAAAKTDDTDAVLRRISEYTRSTRGLGLQSLSIHQIPVKASVLSRAIDLRVLKKITLLNVGPQAPLWALFTKMNSMQPIALRKIFTDNVCMSFLTFVCQLEELHELFILERPDKYKPEPFAPKTSITGDQIRRLILRKHMKTLVKLMIKNERDSSWDADLKMTLHICRRGKALKELAVSMSISSVHTLLQHIPGLTKLRALHIINLRNDDTCQWVMRETKSFIIDNLAHCPNLKLEWLAVDDDEHAERIVRWPPKEEKKKSGKEAPTSMTNGGQLPGLSLDNADLGGDSDEDEGGNGSESGMDKIGTIETPLYEVWGVRIFKKEVIAGRL